MSAFELSDRDRNLLKACLRSDKAEVEAAFAAWRPHANPVQMQGRDLRLMPLLLANLQRFGINDPVLGWLRGQAKHIWLAGALRMRAFQKGLGTLEGEGIPTVLLKGAALLARWRDEVDGRPMGDFDVLVPLDRARAGVKALLATDWRGPAAAVITDDDLTRYHALGLLDRVGNNFDLHWRPAEAIFDPAYADGLIARAVAQTLQTTPVRVPCLTDHLFLLLAHANADVVTARHDWVAEVALLLRRGRAEEFDWTLFRSLCQRYALEEVACRALPLVAGITGRALPDDVALLVSRMAADPPLHTQGDTPAVPPTQPAHAEQAVLDAIERLPSIDRLAMIGADGFDLSRDSGGASFLEGWSVPEQTGRWTNGATASMGLRVRDARAGEGCALRMRLQSYQPLPSQTLEVKAWAGANVAHWSFAHKASEQLCLLDGRVLALGTGAVLPLSFQFEGLVPPDTRYRLSLDDRALGIFLRKIELVLHREFPVLSRPILCWQPAFDRVAWDNWWGSEWFGRWSIGREPCLRVRLPDAPRVMPRAVRLVLSRVFCPTGRPQSLEIVLDGKVVAHAQVPRGMTRGRPGHYRGGLVDVEIPADSRRLGAVLDLRLRLSEPGSPKDAGLSEDTRALGIAIGAVVPLR